MEWISLYGRKYAEKILINISGFQPPSSLKMSIWVDEIIIGVRNKKKLDLLQDSTQVSNLYYFLMKYCIVLIFRPSFIV